MSCFIKKIFLGKIDESIHRQFVRFGKGSYAGRAVISLMKTSKIKVKGSFEYANDFVNLASELGEVRFNGIILSRNDLDDIFIENGEDVEASKKNEMYVYIAEDVSSNLIKQIKDKAYALLLDGEGQGISLKIKKKLPKPGKSGEGKVDDKFCQLEADLEYWNKIKDYFFWDLLECKKANITHTYEINEIIAPKGEKDFEKIRLNAKRKGKIIRKINVDKKESVKEAELEA